jgi:hypothetical protein
MISPFKKKLNEPIYPTNDMGRINSYSTTQKPAGSMKPTGLTFSASQTNPQVKTNATYIGNTYNKPNKPVDTKQYASKYDPNAFKKPVHKP